MATVFLNQDETVDSYKVYNSQKALGRKGNRLFDMHGFDHTGQQNDSRFGTWLMPCPVFVVLHLQDMGRFLVHGELEFTRF